MLGCVEAETCVCACDDDGLTSELGLGDGGGLEELAAEELGFAWHRGGEDSSWSVGEEEVKCQSRHGDGMQNWDRNA